MTHTTSVLGSRQMGGWVASSSLLSRASWSSCRRGGGRERREGKRGERGRERREEREERGEERGDKEERGERKRG